MSKLKYSAGYIAATHDESHPGEEVLHLMGRLFLGSVQKAPGTGVKLDYTDDINLILYSGTEIFWSPKWERYGEDTFVLQSV